jgi:hypothetical protein
MKPCGVVFRAFSVGITGGICAWLAAGVPAQTPSGSLPGTSYASLADLPDFSGWWLGDAARTTEQEFSNQPPPFKPEAARARSATLAVDTLVPLAYCRPREFTGQSGGFTEAMELLFTPGRVTLTTERGLLRRIYTDGRAMPEILEYTNTGTSIGHWEGATLVIETAGIDPGVHFPDRSAGGIPLGNNVVIHERIYLVDDDRLRFDVEILAPDIFTGPYNSSQLFRRLTKTMANEISWCSESDRSLDPITGEQRFDTTPPAGLPPPPPR